MLLVTIECSIISPSLWPMRSMRPAMRSDPKRRMRLSSSETKNCDDPGSPWRPARPRSWRSTRRESWRSVPIMARPPAALDSAVSLMSVPRPAMLVAMVTVPGRPASATMSASFWCSLAFSTWCGILRMFSVRLSSSEISTEVVPTSTGRPALRSFSISSMTALYFSRLVLNTKSLRSSRLAATLVGITVTSSL